MKIWKSDEQGDDRIIAWINETIYRCNPKKEETDTVIFDFGMNKIPSKNTTAIPLVLINQISLDERENYIEVLFRHGQSTEHLRIKDRLKRNEIFEFFKANITNSDFLIERFTKLKTAKKPLIALCVVTVIFIWTFYLAYQMEQGAEYGVTGDNYRSVAGIVLSFAAMGIKNVMLIFGSLFLIVLFAFLKKFRNPKVINRIILKK